MSGESETAGIETISAVERAELEQRWSAGQLRERRERVLAFF